MESTESRPKPIVTLIKPIPRLPRFSDNVAIYCRVSSDSKEQLHSLTNQISLLTRYVYDHPQWKLWDIYVDIESGRDTASRSEFARMMSDCAQQEVHRIITKSVSRFGRNTVDTLNAI